MSVVSLEISSYTTRPACNEIMRTVKRRPAACWDVSQFDFNPCDNFLAQENIICTAKPLHISDGFLLKGAG